MSGRIEVYKKDIRSILEVYEELTLSMHEKGEHSMHSKVSPDKIFETATQIVLKDEEYHQLNGINEAIREQ